MSQTDKNIVDNFRQSCLVDLNKKISHLPTLKQQCTQNLQNQSKQKIEQISKILVQLQDQVIQCLRSKFKNILQIQENWINQEIRDLERYIEDKIIAQVEHYEHFLRNIEGETSLCQKIIGKIATGKVQQQWNMFNQQLLGLKITLTQLNFQKEEVAAIAQDIIDTLNIKYPLAYTEQTVQALQTADLKNQSVAITNPNKTNKCKTQKNTQKNISKVITEKNQSFQKIRNTSKVSEKLDKSKSKSIRRSKILLLRNQSAVSAVSIHLQENKEQSQQSVQSQVKNRFIALDQYKQTKTIRKAMKLEQKLKQKQLSPEKDLQNIVKLALERKKILKNLQ